jgi:dolichol-phosphate mannosyltransferase
MRLLIALPAYNEEACLPPLLHDYRRLFAKLPSSIQPHVIVVDDGCIDKTAEVAEETGKRLGISLEVIRHSENRGLGPAIVTGLRVALSHSTHPRRDVIVCMDADDTHPPSAIPRMLSTLRRDDADIVIASRYRPGSRQVGVPFHRQLLSLGARYLFQLTMPLDGVRDYTCGYRAYRADLVRRGFERWGDELLTRAGFACTDQLLVRYAALGARIREVPFVLRYDRKVGPSKMQLGKTALETFTMIGEARRMLRDRPQTPG